MPINSLLSLLRVRLELLAVTRLVAIFKLVSLRLLKTSSRNKMIEEGIDRFSESAIALWSALFPSLSGTLLLLGSVLPLSSGANALIVFVGIPVEIAQLGPFFPWWYSSKSFSPMVVF